MTAESPAATAVLNTPELLEAILLCFDTRERQEFKTLLLSQRVSKMFKSLIDGSPQLQQALFFRLAPRGAVADAHNPMDYANSLLLEPKDMNKDIIIDSRRTALSIQDYMCWSEPQLVVRLGRGVEDSVVVLATGSWQRMLPFQRGIDLTLIALVPPKQSPGPIRPDLRVPCMEADATVGEILRKQWPGTWL